MSVSLNGLNGTVNNHESRIKALEGKIGAGGGIVESSLNDPGYVKFANGLLVQWGTINKNSTEQQVTLTKNFTNGSSYVVTTDLNGLVSDGDPSNSPVIKVLYKSENKFSIRSVDVHGNNIRARFGYFAIGYLITNRLFDMFKSFSYTIKEAMLKCQLV